jgi:hypothetical protein
VLIGLLALGSIYAYITRNLFIGRPLIVGAVFSLLPAFYLCFRRKKNWNKIIVSVIVFGGIFGFLCDFYSEYTKAWHVVPLVIPYRILGVSSLDDILGFMMMTFLTVVFYEHFVEHERNKHISKNLDKAILPGIFAIIVLLLIYFLNPNLLQLQYPYFYMGIAAILPALFLAYNKPQFIKNMAETAIYFFFFYLIFEIFAVSYGYWIYPSNSYIGWINLLWIRFPFEELFFWMMFYAASLVSYYELFVDEY